MLHLLGKSFQKLVFGLIGIGFSLGAALSLQGQASNTTQPAAPGATAVISPNINGKGAPPSDKSSASGMTPLRLGNGDLVEVGVYNVPELASRVRVDGNGDLYLPLIDYVHVAGLTVTEAQGVIEKRLEDGGFVKSPHVNIFVDEYATQGVSLLGEVVKPGVYPVPGKEQLLDLISAAGGLTTSAGHVVTVTHRDQQDKPVTVQLSKNLGDTPESNIDILAGDTVVVHKADIIYVVGDVTRPSGLLIDRGNITVLQAIALVGGTTPTSKASGARIIHKGPEGMTETPVPLKKILEAKVADMPMKPDDILFVPSSVLKTALRDNASIAVQAASLGLVAAK